MAKRLELWTLGVSSPRSIAQAAERAEAAGWHGIAVVDSQNLAGDCYVALAIAAAHSERLGLGTGVTNPLTRHPAATASAIQSVQVLSGGRAVLGIGRGDSSLAHLGRTPAPVGVLEGYVSVLQRYLSGESVPFDELHFGEAVAAPLEALGLANAPDASRLLWIDGSLPKVPVEVAATGPQVIAVAARAADRVMLALGADPDRIAWGIQTARDARRAAGLDPDGIAFGAYVNAVACPDRAVARELVSGGLTTFARFAVMHGRIEAPLAEEDRRVLAAVHDRYDMRQHTRAGSPQTLALTPGFIDRYAAVGPAREVVARLRELVSLGLGRLIVVGPSTGSDREAARRSLRAFTEEVLPAFAEAE